VQDNLIKNLAADLRQIKNVDIKRTMVSHFYQADKDYRTRLAAAVVVEVKDVQTMSEH
jgi:catalase